VNLPGEPSSPPDPARRARVRHACGVGDSDTPQTGDARRKAGASDDATGLAGRPGADGAEETPSAGDSPDQGPDQPARPPADARAAGAAKAAARSAKAARKAERKAARKAAKREASAARKDAKAAKKAAKRAAKAAKKAAKAARKAERTADDAAAVVREDGSSPRSSTGRKRRTGGLAAGQRGGPESPAPDREGQVEIPAVAGAVLQEVANLVRQTAEPPAARILDRVGRGSEGHLDDGPGSAPEAAAGREPESALEGGPELQPEADLPAEHELEPPPEGELEPPPEGEPGPRVEAEPEPPPEIELEPGPVAVAGVDATLAAAPETFVGACVDIGANSVHLLVGAVTGHRLEALLDESVFLGLGDRVAGTGFLGASTRGALVASLVEYVEAASGHGARDVLLLGTDPLRRAGDAASLVHEVETRTGVPLHVLDHHEEGMLNLLGVTMGRTIDRELVIVDIGGGSSEIVVASPGEPVRTTGLRLGSARLTQDHVREDPPTLTEIEAMVEESRRALRQAPEASPVDLIAVGGTASNLMRLLPATVMDRTLTSRRIAIALAMLTVETSTEAAARHTLRLTRARILPAGAVIVDAILERYAVDRMLVSEAGIREGAVLVASMAGAAWRDRLPVLAAGWAGAAPEPA
jgi:hypothetical protein